MWLALTCIANDANAEAPRVSHRDRLYDVAVQGELVLAVGYPGMLLRSEDGGRSFVRVRVPTHDALFAIAIDASGLTVAVGRAGLVLVSEDRGKSWVTRPVPLGSKEPLYDVTITAAGRIVCVGELGTIVLSTDRGKSFRRAQVSFSMEGSATPDAETADSEEEDENAAVLEEARLTSVAFSDREHGIVVGEFGVVLISGDAGEHFARVESGSDQLLFAVMTTGSGGAVAVGAEGTVLESADRGGSWQRRKVPVTEHLFGVSSRADRTVIVGADGTLLMRSSASDEFERESTRVHTFLCAAAMLDAQRMLIVGGRGHVLVSADAGTTFHRVLGE